MKQNTELICECGLKWREELDFDVEHRYDVRGTGGLFANALTTCPKCEYKGLARGIVPVNYSPVKFYLKREFSLYFPRGGRKPPFTPEIFYDEKEPPNIHLYEEPSSKTLDLKEIAHYLKQKLGDISVDLRGPFFTENSLSRVGDIPKRLARARIQDFSDPATQFEPLMAEVETERKCLRGPSVEENVPYNGFELRAAAQKLLKKDELNLRHIHLVFTRRFFGTWDEKDRRYHARVSVYSFPSLISTTGIVEAMAKPREFYCSKREHIDPMELKEQFKEKFVDYNDERLTEIMKGYAMQAVFYHLTLEPFCSNDRCRLFNAHWQEEVMKAQLGEPEFCTHHERMLEEWKEKYRV